MDIRKFLKPGKNIVIELDDEVEYLISDSAVKAAQRGDREVALVRLYDGAIRMVSLKRIEDVLSKEGVTDYLDKKS